MPSSARGRTGRMWPLAIPAVLILVLLGPKLVGLRSLAPTNQLYDYWPWAAQRPADTGVETAGLFSDNWDIYFPWHIQTAQRLGHGDLPLWSQWVAGGGDLLPNLGSVTIAPSTLIWIAVPDWYAPGLVKAIELLGAWGFLFLFLRRVGVGRAGSIAGGLMFAVAGFQVVWVNWPHTLVNMLVAANLWAWDRVREQPGDPGRLAVSALTTAAVLLEGFPAVAAIGLAAVAVVMVVRVVVDWPGPRPALRSALGVAFGAGLGIGLASISLLPFAARLGLYELNRAAQAPEHLDVAAGLATVLSPNVLGAADGYFGPLNYIETVGYLAPVALALLVAGSVVAIGARHRAALTVTCLSAGLVLLLFSYGVEPVYAILRRLPVLSSNDPGRAKATASILLAVASGLSVDALVRAQTTGAVRWIATVSAAAAAALASVSVWHVADGAPSEHSAFVHQEAARSVVMIVLGLAIAMVLLARRGRPGPASRLATGALVALMAVDALVWIRPYWPNSRPADFYPVTDAHAYVEAHLGDGRLASAAWTFFPGTNGAYGFRSMGGHQFQLPEWREVVRASGGQMLTGTYSWFPSRESAYSPVLDRMGVTLWADSPRRRRCQIEKPGRLSEVATLAVGARVVVDGSGVRGVSIALAEPVDRDARITVGTSDGRTGTTYVKAGTDAGARVYVAVPEPPAGSPSPTALTVLEVGGGPVVVRSTAAGTALSVCRAADRDGLRLVFADGANVYRRLDALPRVRWASSSRVEPDERKRLELLASGDLPSSSVLLHAGTAADGRGTAGVSMVHDEGDALLYRVSAEQPGWLVVADPLQHAWAATVDGRKVDLLPAEHAGVAVAVPAGAHEVALTYRPERLALGIWISACAAVAVLALLAMALFGWAGRSERRG